jgi:catalase
VNQVLDEIGINLSGQVRLCDHIFLLRVRLNNFFAFIAQLSSAPAAGPPGQESQADADLQARFESLRQS